MEDNPSKTNLIRVTVSLNGSKEIKRTWKCNAAERKGEEEDNELRINVGSRFLI